MPSLKLQDLQHGLDLSSLKIPKGRAGVGPMAMPRCHGTELMGSILVPMIGSVVGCLWPIFRLIANIFVPSGFYNPQNGSLSKVHGSCFGRGQPTDDGRVLFCPFPWKAFTTL